MCIESSYRLQPLLINQTIWFSYQEECGQGREVTRLQEKTPSNPDSRSETKETQTYQRSSRRNHSSHDLRLFVPLPRRSGDLQTCLRKRNKPWKPVCLGNLRPTMLESWHPSKHDFPEEHKINPQGQRGKKHFFLLKILKFLVLLNVVTHRRSNIVQEAFKILLIWSSHQPNGNYIYRWENWGLETLIYFS